MYAKNNVLGILQPHHGSETKDRFNIWPKITVSVP